MHWIFDCNFIVMFPNVYFPFVKNIHGFVLVYIFAPILFCQVKIDWMDWKGKKCVIVTLPLPPQSPCWPATRWTCWRHSWPPARCSPHDHQVSTHMQMDYIHLLLFPLNVTNGQSLNVHNAKAYTVHNPDISQTIFRVI